MAERDTRNRPMGAALSNSPFILANSFRLDFYDLYKTHIEKKQKEAEDEIRRAKELQLLVDQEKRLKELQNDKLRAFKG